MANSSKQIRELIGENEIEQAINQLLELLYHSTEHDLSDAAVLQKSRWAEYKRKNVSGLAKNEDIDSIRDALLKIVREIDNRATTGNTSYQQQQAPPRQPEIPPPPPPQKNYVAQCFFNGDPNTYYVAPNNQIVVVNPMSNFPVVVASRTASLNPTFAWIYQFPNGFYYSIDHNGAIWGVNAFGLPVQMGYVQYL
jgi:Effector-associated domain 11